jgi:hypothetical protein
MTEFPGVPRSAALADGSRDIAVDGPVVEYSLCVVSNAFGRWYKSLRTAGVFVVRNALKKYVCFIETTFIGLEGHAVVCSPGKVCVLRTPADGMQHV